MGSWKTVKAHAAPWGPWERQSPAEDVGLRKTHTPALNHPLLRHHMCQYECPWASADTVSGLIRQERGFGRQSHWGRELILHHADAPGKKR